MDANGSCTGEVQPAVTHGIQGESTVGIGELAARTGLPVKTIRYYSDIGLLPESGRSRGGHRRYTSDALSRLRLIQRLRALDAPIAAIATVMTGEHSLADLVTRELDTVQAHIRELAWRQVILRSLDDCPEPERLRRLALLAEVGKPDEAHDRLVRYWHWALPTSLPRRLTRAVIEGAVPLPPATPTSTTVLAYAELRALTSGDDRRRQPQSHQVGDVASFYSGILDACTLAAEAMASGCPARHTEALDHFVRTYARVSGHDDTPAFRAHLRTRFRHAAHHGSFPLRYWRHALAVTGETPPRSTATGQGHLATSLATLHQQVAGLPLAAEQGQERAVPVDDSVGSRRRDAEQRR